MKLNNTQFDRLSIYNFTKDQNFRYVSCSENLLALAGEDSQSGMCGRDDFQVIWKKEAPDIRSVDVKIIKGELKYVDAYEVIDIIERGQVRQLKILITKIPIFNKRGLCIGISGSFINVSSLENENVSNRIDEKGRLLLPKKLGGEYVTAREFQVLKGVLLGRTAEEISKELYISRRTVESHTESLKGKLQCSNKNHLHAAAMELGITHMM